MTRIRLLSSRCWAACALAACSKDGVQDITGADGRLVRQVLQLRRERAERELLRQRREGDGDQLDELHAATGGSEPGVHDYRRRGRRLERRTAPSATPGCTSTLAPGQYAFSGRISATTDNGLSVAKVPAHARRWEVLLGVHERFLRHECEDRWTASSSKTLSPRRSISRLRRCGS